MRLVAGFVLGILVCLGAVWASWRYAPHLVASAEETVTIASVAAEPEVHAIARTSGTVYVFPSEVAKALRPKVWVETWEKRPEDRGCQTKPGSFSAGPCERPDFVRVTVMAQPLWRVALVRVATFNSGHEKLLVKLGSTWIIVADDWYVI